MIRSYKRLSDARCQLAKDSCEQLGDIQLEIFQDESWTMVSVRNISKVTLKNIRVWLSRSVDPQLKLSNIGHGAWFIAELLPDKVLSKKVEISTASDKPIILQTDARQNLIDSIQSTSDVGSIKTILFNLVLNCDLHSHPIASIVEECQKRNDVPRLISLCQELWPNSAVWEKVWDDMLPSHHILCEVNYVSGTTKKNAPPSQAVSLWLNR